MRALYRKVCLIVVLGCWWCLQVVAANGFTVSEVAPGIYVHEGVHEQISLANLGAIGNSGFIVGSNSVAVIDPGGSVQAGKNLKGAIRKLTDLPIRTVILTHFHADHVAGAMAFKEINSIIAHENYSSALAQRAQFYLDRYDPLYQGSVEEVFSLPTQTVSVGDSLNIDLGGRMISIAAHPLAHTNNDVTIHDQNTNSLWASDLVFAQRTPSLDGSLNGWLDVLSQISAMNYALIIPGHGRPGAPAELLEPHIGYLQQLKDEVNVQVAAGVALSVMLEHHDATVDKDSQWKLFSVQHGSNLAKAYTELEWE